MKGHDVFSDTLSSAAWECLRAMHRQAGIAVRGPNDDSS
jgi:hypothetical protein